LADFELDVMPICTAWIVHANRRTLTQTTTATPREGLRGVCAGLLM
jgi:hypothetical protein